MKQSSCYKFDRSKYAWVQASGSKATLTDPRGFASAVSNGTRLWALGGAGNGHVSYTKNPYSPKPFQSPVKFSTECFFGFVCQVAQSAMYYDSEEDKWSKGPRLNHKVYGQCTNILADGTVVSSGWYILKSQFIKCRYLVTT